MKKKILIIIPARGGSKGIPRKNLRILNGKPLLYYAIANSLGLKNFMVDCYISTEDEEIAFLSIKLGAKVVNRDTRISDDKATLDPVIYDAFNQITNVNNRNYDAVITLQPTSPLLEINTLNLAIEHFFSNNIDTLISGVDDTHLTWKIRDNVFTPNYQLRLNRQELPKQFKETGGFVITKPCFIEENSRFGKNIEIFPVSKKESIDIDDFDDWNLCEYYLKRKTVLFVVAGNSEIGMGHVYNSLSIANEILNHKIIFLTIKGSELAYQKILEYNYEVYQQSQSLIDDIVMLAPSTVINDILDTDFNYIQQLKTHKIKTINFEDLGEGAEIADLVINAMYPEKKIIINHYFGAKYFILRDEFIYTNQKSVHHCVKNILISFGGVDPNNYTERILDLLINENNSHFSITVVTGLGYKNSENLKYKYPNVSVKININNISDEIKNSDIVFTSAGRTTFEVASIGVPCIVLCQNKRETTHFFASEKNGFYNLGLGYEVSDSAIIKAFQAVQDFETRKLMQKRMLKNKIKKGKNTVISLIKELI